MARSVQSVVEQALYLSGKADTQFSPVDPSGSDANMALNLFVDILDCYRDQVPFWQTKTLNGENELENINASEINYLKYFIGNVSYLVTPTTQEKMAYYNNVKGLRSLPVYYWFDEQNQKIIVYPLPETSNRQMEIGFKPLSNITSLQMAFPTSWPSFAIVFFKYELAKNLCAFWKIPWMFEDMRQMYYEKMLENSDLQPGEPIKPSWKANDYPVPWLSYLSGNIPHG